MTGRSYINSARQPNHVPCRQREYLGVVDVVAMAGCGRGACALVGSTSLGNAISPAIVCACVCKKVGSSSIIYFCHV